MTLSCHASFPVLRRPAVSADDRTAVGRTISLGPLDSLLGEIGGSEQSHRSKSSEKIRVRRPRLWAWSSPRRIASYRDVRPICTSAQTSLMVKTMTGTLITVASYGRNLLPGNRTPNRQRARGIYLFDVPYEDRPERPEKDGNQFPSFCCCHSSMNFRV